MVDITNRRQQKNMHMYGTCAHTPTCSCCIARTSSARSAAISMPANNMVSRRFKRVSAHLRIELRSTIQHACRRSSTQEGTVLSRRHCVTNTTMYGRSRRQKCTPRQGSTTRGAMWMVLIRQQHTTIMNAHLLFVLHLHSVSGVESSQTFAVYYAKLKSRYSLRI